MFCSVNYYRNLNFNLKVVISIRPQLRQIQNVCNVIVLFVCGLVTTNYEFVINALLPLKKKFFFFAFSGKIIALSYCFLMFC